MIAVSSRQISFGGLSSLLVETISGVRVVKAFGMEKYESKKKALIQYMLMTLMMATRYYLRITIEQMNDSLVNLIHMEESGIHVDVRPS